MTDVDDPPELERLEEGDEVRVYYLSDRTANMVDRRGTVAGSTTNEDGDTVVWVFTDRMDELMYQYVALLRPFDHEAAQRVVIAVSVTLKTRGEPPDMPLPGESWVAQFTIGQTTKLGVVDRVMREGLNINLHD